MGFYVWCKPEKLFNCLKSVPQGIPKKTSVSLFLMSSHVVGLTVNKRAKASLQTTQSLKVSRVYLHNDSNNYRQY